MKLRTPSSTRKFTKMMLGWRNSAGIAVDVINVPRVPRPTRRSAFFVGMYICYNRLVEDAMEKTKSKLIPTIGLEIHAELATETKMFCNSPNDPDEKKPNVNVCPVCMGYPGTLPTINKKAILHMLRIGTALGGKLCNHTFFERKNYFYPDLPKGYQISQYQYPLVSGGVLCGVAITRVHLEEDTARLAHDAHEEDTLIDFNRAGAPLMELVTEPVITGGKEAADFAKELQLLLRYLGASDANMEKGQMRVEPNVSVGDGKTLGTKVELKNLNSFRVVERAVAFEIARQTKCVEKGEKIVQETRGWDEKKQVTFSQRTKEESHDYRYFPEPDLPAIVISEVPEFQNVKEGLPELPWEKRERLKKEYGIKGEDVESFVQNIPLSHFFEDVSNTLHNEKETVKLAANYITSDILGLVKKENITFSDSRIGKLDPANFSELIKMTTGGEISSRGAKDIIPKAIAEGKSVRVIAEEMELFQKSDEEELKQVVEKIIRENETVVREYKGGKEQSLKFLIGQAMRDTGGAANPQVLAKLFKETIK